MKTDVSSNVRPAVSRTGSTCEAPTLREFWTKYLPYARTNKRPNTVRCNVLSFSNLVRFLGDVRLDAITPYAVEEFKASRLVADVTPASTNRDLALLKNLFTVAILWGFIDRNPVHDVKLLREPPPRTRYLAPAELDRLLFAAPRHLVPIIKIAVYTGMRVGEILGITWADVAPDGGSVRLLRTKNGEARLAYLSTSARDVIAEARARKNGPYVFHFRGRRIGSIKTAWRKTVRLAGIDDFRFHDLRHTFASHMVMRGADIQTVQTLLGHKSITMTTKYSHLSAGHLREAVEKVADLGTV